MTSDYERRVQEERDYRSSWTPPPFPDREDRAEQVIRNHGLHIRRQAAELQALRAQVERIRRFVHLQETQNVAWVPTQALRWVVDNGEAGS